MLDRKSKLLTLAGILLLSSSVNAENTKENYMIVAPSCLIKKVTSSYESLSSSNQLSLIKVNQTAFNELIAAKDHQKEVCGGFINVTDAWKNYQLKSFTTHSSISAASFLSQYIPTKQAAIKTERYAIQHTKEVAQLIGELNPQEMWNYLTTFSNFPDRYSKADTGVTAANWIKTQVETIAKTYGRNDVKIFFIDTGSSYKQPSVVVKIGTSTEPGIVIGSHMDTLARFFGNMPGADDDGTGSVTVLETARTLLASHIHFKKPIYLIWYAAEEMGLVGSQHVVAEFKKQNIAIQNVIHFDMTGYAAQNDPTMWLIKDNTNEELTAFLASLITTYINQPIKYTSCGYACSDHATWTVNGYKAAIAFEAAYEKYNPYIHTAQDQMNVLSLNHMTDYAKLSLAFAGELAEPIVS